jgi:hypothetical protein
MCLPLLVLRPGLCSPHDSGKVMYTAVGLSQEFFKYYKN